MVLAQQGAAVCIVGYGARTAVGATALASAAAVRAAVSMFGDHPYMIDKGGIPMVVAKDAFLSEEVMGVERFIELGLPAAGEALAALSEWSGVPIGVQALVGIPPERPGLPPRLAEQIVDRFRQAFRGQVRLTAVETVAAGHAAGLMALAEASRRIKTGQAEWCLGGGIESYLEPETLEWLDDADRLYSENNSWGFIPGEAAAFCLLCTEKTAQRYGLKPLGQVLATATATESKLITDRDAVCLGEGLTKAFREVLAALPAGGAKVDAIICDLNGESYRADEFGYAVVRTSDRFVSAGEFLNPADCWGDVGAASGPLFIVLTVIAAHKGYSRGPHTLLWTSSDGGHRSAALLQTGIPSEVA